MKLPFKILYDGIVILETCNMEKAHKWWHFWFDKTSLDNIDKLEFWEGDKPLFQSEEETKNDLSRP